MLLGGFAAVAQEESLAPTWTLDVWVDPALEEIHGIRASDLNADVVAVHLLTHKDLPDKAQHQPVQFEAFGDFNRDGRSDVALVGVLKTRQGKKQQFLLVLSNLEAKIQTVLLFVPTEGDSDFSDLTVRDDRIIWMFCVACDDGVEYTWDGKTFVDKYLGESRP